MEKPDCWQSSEAPQKSRKKIKEVRISGFFIENMKYEVAMSVCVELNAICRHLNILLPPSRRTVAMYFQAILRPAVMIKVRVESHESSDLKKIFLRDVLEEFKKRNNNSDIDQVSRHKYMQIVQTYIKEREKQEDIMYQTVINGPIIDQTDLEMPLLNNASLCKQISDHLPGFYLYDKDAQLQIHNILICQVPLLSLDYNFSECLE